MSAINPIRIVESTTIDLVRETRETSLFWDQAFDAVHKVHLVWKTFEKLSIYGNPDNFLELFAGHSLQWLAGDNIFVKIAASSVLIATRIMECVKEELILLKEVQKLSDVCFDNTFLTPNRKWAKPEDFVFLSPSCSYWLRSIFIAFMDQVVRILQALIRIMKQLFVLSMRMISAADSFSLDHRVVREGTTELFVNLGKCHKVLIENKELLLDFLKEYQSVIEKVLEGLGNVCSYKTLVESVEKAIRVTDESAHESENEGFTLKKYGSFAFKSIAFGLFQSLNMHTYLPRDWIPEEETDWMVENQSHPRYPPKNWVQIYKHEIAIKKWHFKKGADNAGKSMLYNEL